MQIESPLTRFDAWNPSAIRIFRACKGLTVPLITGTGPSARSLCHRMGAETCIAHAARILDGASSRLLCAGSATRGSARTSRLASSRDVPRNPRIARLPSGGPRCLCRARSRSRLRWWSSATGVAPDAWSATRQKRAIRVSTRSLLLGARAPLSQVDSAAGPTRAAVACLGVAGRRGF